MDGQNNGMAGTGEGGEEIQTAVKGNSPSITRIYDAVCLVLSPTIVNVHRVVILEA